MKSNTATKSPIQIKEFPSSVPKDFHATQCVQYGCYYENNSLKLSSASLDEMKCTLKLLLHDYQHLLYLDLYSFWTQIVFDKSILASIDSYLRNVPRDYYSAVKHLPSHIRSLHDEIHRSVFLLLLRCSSNKDPQSGSSLDLSLHSKLIYDYYIFDVPRLVDFICLYGKQNGKIITKMIDNLFKQQTNYFNDFKGVFLETELLLNRACDDLNIGLNLTNFMKNPSILRGKLSLSNSNFSKNVSAIIDAMLFVTDCCECFRSLVSLSASSVFLILLSETNVATMLAFFYDLFVPFVQECYELLAFDGEAQRLNYENALMNMCLAIVEVGQSLLLFHSNDKTTDQYLTTWQTILNAPLFICACEAVGELRICLADRLQDELKNENYRPQAEYLLSSIDLILRDLDEHRPMGFLSMKVSTEAVSNKILSTTAITNGSSSSSSSQLGPSSSSSFLSMEVQTVQQILPHIPVQVIQDYLQSHNNNVENVIGLLCDYDPNRVETKKSAATSQKNGDHLPQSSSSSTTAAASSSRDVNYAQQTRDNLTKKEKQRILQSYAFEAVDEDDDDDGNNFDVRKSELKWEREQQGKTQTISRMLSDGVAGLEFEDEYDDTYESPVAAYEHENIESFVDINPNHAAPLGEDDFAQTSSDQQRPHHDVRGRGRGRGQTTEVLRNREWKEKNKSKSANHNRRYLADKKRRGAF